MLIFRNGQKTITLPKFEPESYIKALDTYKPTFLNLVNLDFKPKTYILNQPFSTW